MAGVKWKAMEKATAVAARTAASVKASVEACAAVREAVTATLEQADWVIALKLT